MFLYNTFSLSCTNSLPGGACGAEGSAPPYVGTLRQGQPHSLCLERHRCPEPVLSVSTTDASQPGSADAWGQVHYIISYVTLC